jgi:hypothetical protein
MHENCLLIGYLTCMQRASFFQQFINFMNKLENKSKDKILIYILTDENSFNFFWLESLKFDNIRVEFAVCKFVEGYCNYMDKISMFIGYAKNNNFEHLMKLDNDIIINNYVLDYMIENIWLLNDEKNLLITPVLSSGIPTVEMFIKDFFNEKEKKIIYEKFRKTQFGHIWGFNYTNLGQSKLLSWDGDKFFSDVKNTGYHYMGIHPIRINPLCILELNNIILSKKDELFKKQDYWIQVDKTLPYLCNSVFIMKTETYNKIIFDRSLYVDPFDEVPVNKYCAKYNLNKIFIRNSFTLHPVYNTLPNHLIYENDFLIKIFS